MNEKENKLYKILNHAINNVQYFRNRVSATSTMTAIELLNKFPILTKKEVNTYKDILFSDHALEKMRGIDPFSMKEFLIPESTSGSSGFPIVIYKTKIERFQLAVDLWSKRKLIDDRVNQNNMFCLIHLPHNQEKIIKDTRNLHPDAIQQVLDHLIRNKPLLLHSTPSDLIKYAEYIINNNVDLKDWKLAFIESNSEVLTESDRQLIENTFQTKVVNAYGSREVWSIGYECKAGVLHLSDNVHVEIVALDSNNILGVDHDEYGEVVITSLVLKEYPFIRYRMGDLAKLKTSTCCCGSKNHIIELHNARKINLIHQVESSNKITNGVSLFKGVLWDMLSKGYSGINRYKVIQSESKLFEVYIVFEGEISQNFTKDFSEFSKRRLEQDDITILIKKVDNDHEIFNGKSYSFISKIKI